MRHFENRPNQRAGKVSGIFLRLAGLVTMLASVNAPASTNIVAPPGWRLVWSDEFNQPDGSAPNPVNWSYDTGGLGWGNKELQYYTLRTNNSRIEDGKLIIEAHREAFDGRHYTSARLLTLGKASWTYGRVEARIKISRGQGLWPAF